MKRKVFYVLLFNILTVALFLTATNYLGFDIYAAEGDICFCGCEDDAFDNCDYACRYHDGCLAMQWIIGKCDISATSCNNSYELLCEDRTRKNFVCSEACSECDTSFWQ